jgi:hypothetical protein
VRNPAHWAEKYLGCVNVGVPACEKPLIDWALARKTTNLSSYNINNTEFIFYQYP